MKFIAESSRKVISAYQNMLSASLNQRYFVNQREILHRLNPDDIETLENRTEGWIAGLQMAALSLRGRQARKPIARLVDDFAGTHQYVMDYLGAEVLRQQPTEIRAFLRQTAITIAILNTRFWKRERGTIGCEVLRSRNIKTPSMANPKSSITIGPKVQPVLPPKESAGV